MTVTVQSAYAELAAAVCRLRDTARELELIAVSDHPRGGDVALVDEVANAALEVSGAAEETTAAFRDTTGGAAAVSLCQTHILTLGQILVGRLASPERLTELDALGAEHGHEAGAWAGEVVRCVHTCQQSLWSDVLPALFAHGQETAALKSPCSTSGVRR
ncbi:hypothetical protein ACFY1L_18880 [Streptomyces sp. NPDC001663]|uniref:hypothetical protein n=1 Tax=Streptomyces sp. NPDC001663 TaxID=3364597 RepID=UPI0036980A5B